VEGSPKRRKTKKGKIRVYHFVGPDYGLDDIRRRRLKIATIADLNDPFELLPSSADQTVRARFNIWRLQFDQRFGMLCFSRKWTNPVQWSHYAVKHTGICFGFDIPANMLAKVRYTTTRLMPRVDVIEGPSPANQKEMFKVLTTKYLHWRYEHEVRIFTALNEKDVKTGLYFADFADKMKLKEVIVGPLSTVTRADVSEAIGDLKGVKIYKARLAFKTYRVTRQRNPKMWGVASVMQKPRSSFIVTNELASLAKTLADWGAPAPAAVIYLYGSRVRGDHKATSDVDICVEFPKAETADAQWWTQNNQDYFKTIGQQLGARIEVLERNSPIRSKIIGAEVVHQDRNVRCVLLPPFPKA
jgi:predicted nucleotidyltransferase